MERLPNLVDIIHSSQETKMNALRKSQLDEFWRDSCYYLQEDASRTSWSFSLYHKLSLVHLTDQLSFDSFEKLEEKHKASLFYYIYILFYYFTFDKEGNFGIEQNLKLAICTNKDIKGETTKEPVPVLSHWLFTSHYALNK